MHYPNVHFPKYTIKGDEKKKVSYNFQRYESELTLINLQNRRICKRDDVCVWLDLRRILCLELLKRNETQNAHLHVEQLQHAHNSLAAKHSWLVSRKYVVPLHDDTRSRRQQ